MSSRDILRALYLSSAAPLVLAAPLVVAAPAMAQTVDPAPVRQSVDANGVDLFHGTMNVDAPALTIGAGETALAYHKLNRGNGWSDSITAQLFLTGSGGSARMNVSMGGRTDAFTVSGTTYTATQGNGATLTYNGSNAYTYTASDGTVATFAKNTSPVSGTYAGYVTQIVRPSGVKLVFGYIQLPYCAEEKQGGSGTICMRTADFPVLTSVRNSYGYQLTFARDLEPFDQSAVPGIDEFRTRETPLGVTVSNLAAPSGPAPAQTFSESTSGNVTTLTVSDAMGRQSQYRTDLGLVTAIRRPGSTSDDVTIAYSGTRVSSVTNAAGTWNYVVWGSPQTRVVMVMDPLNHGTMYTFDVASERMTLMQKPHGDDLSWEYDTSGRVTKITQAEGNATEFVYDSRGNVITRTETAKPGSGLANIVTSAAYDATCANVVTCNQPNTTTDAFGKVTEYAYDPVHGGVTSVKRPAASTGGTRPEVRYGYTSLQASFNTGSGITASGEPVWRLTSTSACTSGTSCQGTAAEVKTALNYAPPTGPGNNLLLKSVSSGSGDGVLTATTTYDHDSIGNVTTVDGPLGSADVTTYRYNANRELTGAISADPGNGQPRRANRMTYDVKGRVTLAETGTVAGPSDVEWPGFSASQGVVRTYDGVDRPLVETLVASGTPYSLMQYGYAGHLLQCTAVRMNPSTWSSLPDACTQGTTGAFGPDRIVKMFYDGADRVEVTHIGVGTSDLSVETINYTTNGLINVLIDGRGNQTTYEYDGFDRLATTFFPQFNSGAYSSSPLNLEVLNYDTGGRVISRQLRDGQMIGFAYDDLGRVTAKTLPTGEPSVVYAYDLLGRMTSAYAAAYGINDQFAYDALGRVTSEAQAFGTTSYQYDPAGRRTRMTWSDNNYVSYTYLVTGEMASITENAAASLLTSYSYDALGRRIGIARGNGTTTSYVYDAVSRLGSLAHDIAGTAYDVSYSYGYNPAGQIVSRTAANDFYAYTEKANANASSGHNGLNQVSGLSHDARGNTTTYDGRTFAYTSENLLKSASNGVSLYYDPMGRLAEYDTNVSKRFYFDGMQVAAEVANPSGAITKRYVFGASPDELVIEYNGAAMNDKMWAHLDERNTVVAGSVTGGNVGRVNRYDEYGVPGTANTGWFGYTGQAYLPELGMHYYKARMYEPKLGRFMQADPIGYGDGMNRYGYVKGDPVNSTDPLGLFDPDIEITGRRRSQDDWGAPVILEFQLVNLRDAFNLPTGIEDMLVPEILVIGDRGKARPTVGSNVQWPQNSQVGELPFPRQPDPDNPAQRPNGCTIVPNVAPQSCNAHDVCYGTLGVSKAQCDFELWQNIKVELGSNSDFIARLYFTGVTALGTRFYNQAQSDSFQHYIATGH